ncbi:hypothetical protein [Tranquillimonas rosea]|uniref:hypothetical protein n=1 Tax=Tranquillimonas rosea TaxID=641238 RepID=UPI003BAA04B7
MTTERLQSAISKARQERGRTTPAAPSREAWDEIPSLDLRSDRLRSNRIVSADGGTDATAFDVLRTRLLQRMAENGWRRGR